MPSPPLSCLLPGLLAGPHPLAHPLLHPLDSKSGKKPDANEDTSVPIHRLRGLLGKGRIKAVTNVYLKTVLNSESTDRVNQPSLWADFPGSPAPALSFGASVSLFRTQR